ncbi:hypothetical protein IGB42_01778 [Andreprevotia sp. IGB-42]|uniref:hypothetical protein n=1 Tax=Andreprevotia sp. IGB-42 TaxID=2497473 RepID=UPI00135C26B0|nr:hypothetical protein [Andreprevotia sp. IGB-42]KAF0813427.1 hypothetical protein IGB42_01778 [Andreprevotia sp. IGB-42]
MNAYPLMLRLSLLAFWRNMDKRMLWVFIPLLLLALIGLLAGPFWEVVWIFGGLIPGVALALAWWAAHIRFSLRQHTPANAQLVPRHRQRLMWLTYALWLGSSALLATGLALPWGHFTRWWAGLLYLFMLFAWSQREVRGLVFLLWLPVLSGTAYYAINSRRMKMLTTLPYAHDALNILFLGGLLLAGMVMVARLYPRSSDAHWRWYQWKLTSLHTQQGGTLPNMAETGIDQLKQYLSRRLHRSGCSSKQDMFAALGSAFQPSTQAGRGLMVCAGSVATMLASRAFWPSLFNALDWHALPLLMAAPITILGTLRQTLYATRGDQSLLLLLPGTPQGKALNQALARRCLLLYGISWLASTVAVLLGCLLFNVAPALFDLSVLLSMGNLLLAGFVITDYTVLKQRSPFIWMMMAIMLIVILRTLFMTNPDMDMNLLPPVLVCMGAAATIIAYRYRKAAHAPTAFPVGRLHNAAILAELG